MPSKPSAIKGARMQDAFAARREVGSPYGDSALAAKCLHQPPLRHRCAPRHLQLHHQAAVEAQEEARKVVGLRLQGGPVRKTAQRLRRILERKAGKAVYEKCPFSQDFIQGKESGFVVGGLADRVIGVAMAGGRDR